jgi:cyclic pyranopterin monophosphate synthase
VLSHISEDFKQPNMVDISIKSPTVRAATAQAKVILPENVYRAVQVVEGRIEINSKKGPVLGTAIVAGVMAAKRTSDLIPFCHPIPIDGCSIEFSQEAQINEDGIESGGGVLLINVTVKTTGKTGVEMEALVSASITALTVYDMLKAISHDIEISNVRLIEKSGGKSDYNKNAKTRAISGQQSRSYYTQDGKKLPREMEVMMNSDDGFESYKDQMRRASLLTSVASVTSKPAPILKDSRLQTLRSDDSKKIADKTSGIDTSSN